MGRTPAITYQLEVLQEVCELLEEKPDDDPITFTASEVGAGLRSNPSMRGIYEKKLTLTAMVSIGVFQIVSVSSHWV